MNCLWCFFYCLLYFFAFFDKKFLVVHGYLIFKLFFHFFQFILKFSLNITHIFFPLLNFFGKAINTFSNSNSNPTFKLQWYLIDYFFLHFFHFYFKIVFNGILIFSQSYNFFIYFNIFFIRLKHKMIYFFEVWLNFIFNQVYRYQILLR